MKEIKLGAIRVGLVLLMAIGSPWDLALLQDQRIQILALHLDSFYGAGQFSSAHI